VKIYPSPYGSIIRENNFEALTSRLKEISFSKAFVIADSNTADYCVPLLGAFISGLDKKVITQGEPNKTMHQCGITWSWLIENGADKNSIILNVGGGMITDLGGFVASCFQRGIRFIQVPTSLLAMTDAAIGGKVGVDFQGYKNYIGTFNSPSFTWINIDFLKTLPPAEIKNGLTEIVKHAIIGSEVLWEKLNAIGSLADINWEELLDLSIHVKIEVIEQDPTEKGFRKILNFGHTIGHALESHFLSTETPLTHGQSVALGILAESKLALDASYLSKNDFEKIVSLVTRLLKPPAIAIPKDEEILPWMSRDKKNIRQAISFSLPTGIGTCRWGLTSLDPAPALEWLRKTSFR